MNKNINDYSKIKNIIFDLDNTIILDKEEDAEYYKDVLTKLGYNNEGFLKIYQLVDDYDKSINEENPYYDSQKMLEFINKELHSDFQINVIEEIKNDSVSLFVNLCIPDTDICYDFIVIIRDDGSMNIKESYIDSEMFE